MNADNRQISDDSKPLPCICALVRKAGRVLTKQYDDSLKSSGLRITQYSLLMNIRFNPEIPVSGLSKLMKMDQTTITRNVKVLEKSGFVSIRPDPEDQRIKRIEITGQGKALLKEARIPWLSAQDRVAGSLDIEQTRQLIRLLEQVIEMDA